MENQPHIEQPSKEELTAEIERHFEAFRSYQEELEVARELNAANLTHIQEKIEAEKKIIEEKQKLLEQLN